MSIRVNIQISGVSVSGDIDTKQIPVTINLGNSDQIGQVEFALQNSTNTYTSYLASGNATYQMDIINNGVTAQTFRGTLEKATNMIDVAAGSITKFTGYDYAQELLGLLSPDARQKSIVSGGILSLVSGEQGMASLDGMDLVLAVSGVIGSGTTGYSGGATGGTPQVTLSAFMNQYYGRSGDTTGSNSGTLFSFKPYLSGMAISGSNPAYRTFYVQDGASDTNANYWIPFDTLKVRHEYAWDVLRKLTRQGYVVDRSGFKVQFEAFIDSSGGINLLTSGTSNFVSSGVLIYYKAGTSGASNNNIIDAKAPTETTGLKNEVVAWFPIWSIYPLDADTYTDTLAYSGGYWSGANPIAGSVTLSGNSPAPGADGFVSIMGTNISGSAGAQGGFTLLFTLWSGTSLNVARWNVSGGAGVNLVYNAQPSANQVDTPLFHSTIIYDTSGNFIVKSGPGGGGTNQFSKDLVRVSGWTPITDTIYKTDGTFNSGTGQDGGWAFGALVASASGIPDLTRVKQIGVGFGYALAQPGNKADTMVYIVDNLNFQFAYNFNPVVAYNSGSIATYGRRYEIFEFPYQYTDSGAASVVLAELQSKMFSRQIGEFKIKDNPNQSISAQFNITPGQVFIVDAPSLGTGSGQLYFYWRATDVRHEWSHSRGFLTTIKAYPWFSGATVLSGQNLISYALPLPYAPPRINPLMPITAPYLIGPVRGIPGT